VSDARPKVDWTNVLAVLGAAILPAVVTIYGGQQVMEAKAAAITTSLDGLRDELREHRSNIRDQMLQLHNQQAREIDANQRDIRELRGDRGR
jgi:hypothetical protein